MEDNTLNFFNNIFDAIPSAYKQIPQDYEEAD